MEKVLIVKKQGKKYSFKKRLKASKFLLLMIIPAIVYYVIFCYIPMYGVLLAFTKYSPSLGITESILQRWVGFAQFQKMFAIRDFWPVVLNTLMIGSLKVIIGFVAAIIVAIVLNEIRLKLFKKGVQIIVTFPHFLSWVIVASFFMLMFGSNGVFNNIVKAAGGSEVPFFSSKAGFLSMIFTSDVWKDAGWGSIIYLATMAGISPDLYEAADMDGATRLQKIWHITLPGIKSTAILLLILAVGGVMSGGFDQIFNLSSSLSNSAVVSKVQIIDTFIYYYTFKANIPFNQGLSTAIGLFKSVISFTLVIITDRIAKACGERGII